ncbi:hypothetical protein ACQJBY_054250 [Aegilops geniculata]
MSLRDLSAYHDLSAELLSGFLAEKINDMIVHVKWSCLSSYFTVHPDLTLSGYNMCLLLDWHFTFLCGRYITEDDRILSILH